MTVDDSPKIRLHVLGPVRVERPSETSTVRLLTQPRRVAVLVYLALARPRGLHARDTLISLFWPESDDASGRHALRNALHAIRQALGESVIVTAGDGLVGLDAARVDCDALRVEAFIASGNLEAAVEHYCGELLRGFHVSDAREFDHWLDAERRRLHEMVLAAAWSLVDTHRKRGAPDRAFEIARRAVGLSPDDEAGLVRLLEVARDGGDRAAALRAYDDFANRQRRELDTEPSAETRRLVRVLQDTAPALGARPVATTVDGTPRAWAPGVSEGTGPHVMRGKRMDRRVVMLGFGVAVLLAGAFAMSRTGQSSTSTGTAPAVFGLGTATQMTTDEGLEIQPAISPDGSWIAYAAGNSVTMRIFFRALGGGSAIPITNDSSALEAAPRWSPDGTKMLYLSNGSVRIGPAFGGTALTVVAAATGDSVTSATWSPDGKQIAFTRHGTLFVRSLDGGAPRPIATDVEPHSCTWSPTGALIACASGNVVYAHSSTFGNLAPSSIIVFPVAGGAPHPITDRKALNQSPEWSADGRTLYFVSDRLGTRDVYAVAIDAEGDALGEPRRVTTGLNVHSMVLSRDGLKLLYSVYTERANVWSIPISTRPTTAAPLEPVTSGNQIIEAMRVTRDGRWLLYDSNKGGTAEIYRVRLPHGEPVPLTHDGHNNFRPDLSPDGTEVAYHSWKTGSRDIVILRLSDGRVQPVTSTPRHEAGAIWSPDGRMIAFSDVAQASGQPLFVVRRDTAGAWGTPRPLGKGSYGAADWSPSSRHLAVVADGGLAIVDVQTGRRTVLRDPPRPDTDDRPLEQVVWSGDGRTLYLKSHDGLGRATFWSMSASGGRLRRLATLDDRTRPSNRPDFGTDGRRLYFAVQDRQSDVWIADVVRPAR